MKLTNTFEITDTTDSHSKDTGALVLEGGVGIEKNLNVGQTFTVSAGSTFQNVNVTGITTLAGLVFFENGILVNDVGVASATDNVINSKNGDLVFEAESGTVQVNANLNVTNTVDAGQLTVDQTTLNGNTLQTISGNNDLILQAHNVGIVSCNDRLQVNSFTFDGDSENYDSVITTLDPNNPPADHDKLISARAVGVAIDGIDQILTVSADSPNGTNEGITLGTETLNFAGTANEIETTVSSNQIQIGLPNNVTIGNNLTATNTLGANRLNVDDLRLDGNIISTTPDNTNINLRPNGTGSVVVGTTQNPRNVTIHGTLTVNGTDNNFEHLEVDNVEIQGNTITTVNNDGNLILDANGTGDVECDSRISADAGIIVRNDSVCDVNDININGILDLTGSGHYAEIKSVRIGDISATTISTTSGSLTLDPEGNNNVIVGQSGNSNTDLVCRGDVIAFQTSDLTLKDNVTRIPDALDKVLSLSGNTFTWIEGSKYEGENDTGVIAQEVEALGLPGLTTIRDSGKKAVRYEKLIPVLIEAIKELKSEIEELKK
jgi:hypothetical protein